MHAAHLMADRGWLVDLLSSPEQGTASLQVTAHPGLHHHATMMRRQNAIRPYDYYRFVAKAAYLSRNLRPDIVYASDPLACGPGLIAARLAGATLVYHEHDSPSAGALRSWVARLRTAAIKRAKIVILPNLDRGRLLFDETKQPSSKLRIVWNMPRRGELPPPAAHDPSGLAIYFHGSITSDRLPETVIHAIRRFDGRVRLKIAGYEAPGAPGYLARLLALGSGSGRPLVEYLGQIPREDLLRAASGADVGLALMPNRSDDVNMRHMVGASNKPFDYMAAGLALLVSDLPDWTSLYCAGGFGQACDPVSAESIAGALSWFLDHPAERRSMGERGRVKIQEVWNYDAAFAGVLDELGTL
jgi:glycosyltransferase involved in cell wall biosynthesis